MQMFQFLKDKATEVIGKTFSNDLSSEDSEAEITPCQNEKFGHYQCNSPLRLAKLLKTNPRVVAQKILESFLQEKESSFFSQIEIAGPGFINFTFHPEFVAKEVQKILLDARLNIPTITPKAKVIVEFSSPNIAKELHVGHLRSTIIGESLARVFEFLGYEVLRLNHIGDWGTQFGMLIAYLKEKKPEILEEEKQLSLEELMNCYKSSKKLFDEDPSFKKRAQLEVVSLQARDETSLHIWEKICHISRITFEKIYRLLDVSIQERGESFYHPFLHQVIEEIEKKDLVEVSDGAKCVFLEGFVSKDNKPLPLIIQKSDGGFNYATTDLAALRHRVLAEKADRILLVVDQGQALHFSMVFATAKKAGFYDPAKTQVDHVGFGVVLGTDGKKFKTRSGESIKLIQLLEDGILHAKKILEEKVPDMNPQEKEHLAENIGIAAIKYADLSSHRQKDYIFSYDRMLRFEGNTAVFLLYSYVRIQGIKRRVKANMSSLLKNHTIKLNHPSEISLGFHLLRFSEVLEQVAQDLLPHRLCDYLYEMAEKFNAFFRDCRVEGEKEQNSRLLLCEAVGKTLKQGLYLLGIKTVDRM